jgi:Na+/phosphate symporter
MLIAIVPLLMIVAGALIYGLATNPKVAEIGRLCLQAGLIALAFAYAGHVVGVGR